MRDPLFEQTIAYLTAYRRIRDAALKEVEGIADAEAIVSSLAEWCRDILFNGYWVETENEDYRLSDLLTFSPAHSPLQAFQDIPDATRRQSLEKRFTALMEGSENDKQDVLGWLFGQALAKGLVDKLAVGEEPPKHLLAGLWNLVKQQALVHSALEDSLRKLLHNSPHARSAILADIENQISDINDNPGIGTLYTKDQEDFNSFVDTWRSSASIDELWKDHEGLIPVRYDLLNMLPSILPTDRAAILAQLDRFNFPHPIRQILGHDAILHDRDEIAAALKGAPICSEDGRSWNGRLLALLVLQTAEDHCHALWEAIRQAENTNNIYSQVRETTKTTLASWFEELGCIVMARPDGEFLGSQWLLMKVVDERLDRARRGRAGDRAHEYLWQDDLIAWITLGLSKAGLTSRAIAALVDFPKIPAVGELAPARSVSCDDEEVQPRLGALSMMALLDHMINESAEDGQGLLGCLDALLASRDSAFEVESLLSSGTSELPANCCGYLLAHVEEPAERWRQSWDRLIEQRRRAQHWNQTDDADALAPSLFLLAIGISGIDWLLSAPHGRPDKAKVLWRELFDGVRECWLTISLTHLVERIETHLLRLFARHPKVFDDSVSQGDTSEPNVAHDAGYSERLAQDLYLLGGDDLMLTLCCLNASRNGATPAVMDEVLKRNSGHLDAILQQFERWQELERPVRKRPEIVEALAKLREEIEAIGDDFAHNDIESC